MKTLAIVGAGAGLGRSIAKLFGRNGFRVALIARGRAKLDDLAAQLGALGIEAAGFEADLMDRPSLVDAFARITKRYGPVDVLEYSPAPHTPVPGVEIAGSLAVTVDNLQPQIDFYTLNRYFHAMGQVISRHGGYIDNYMGDGLMELLGVDDGSAPEPASAHSVLGAADWS